ncbi:hypothetical protein [Actinomyces sp. 565]|uniref:hypothetical protein n=1 Tax=Actinomyces sp. 565 TaxID=2057794 RepID=UPI001EF0B9AA|nr:hypothetical protein [Actinomyces sp. 565]
MSTDTNAAGHDPEDHATAADRAESAAWELAAAPHDSADSSTPAASLTTSSADPADEAVQPPHAPTPAPPAPDPAPAPVPPTPGSAPTADPAASAPAAPDAEPAADEPRSEDDILLEGSSVVGHPKSRAAAHWVGVLVWVVALPLAWYFLHDGAAAAVDGATPMRFGLSVRALLELAAGAAALAFALWTASRSSLGSFVVGVISVLAGLPFLVAPAAMNDAVGPLLDRLTAHSSLGAALSAYWWADAISGKFIAFGLFMIMVGVVSHQARRAGRREQEIIDRVRRA